jgi:hypothetical protein
MTKISSKSNGLAKTKTTKKVANSLPTFKVLAPPFLCANGKLNWGIGETTDYSIFRHINEDYDGLNRKTTKSHKDKVNKSIMKNGDSLSVKVCVYEGIPYPIDGNNRGESMDDGTGSPIRFSFRYVDTLEELMENTIDHNDKARNWGTGQYVSTHATMGSKTYKTIQEVVKKQGLNITIAAAIVGNTSVTLAKKYIRSGDMVMDNAKFARERAQNVKIFLTKYNEYPNLEQRVCEGLISFIGSIGWNDFFYIKIKLAEISRQLTLKGYMVGKTNASDFEDLFKKAYMAIK